MVFQLFTTHTLIIAKNRKNVKRFLLFFQFFSRISANQTAPAAAWGLLPCIQALGLGPTGEKPAGGSLPGGHSSFCVSAKPR